MTTATSFTLSISHIHNTYCASDDWACSSTPPHQKLIEPIIPRANHLKRGERLGCRNQHIMHIHVKRKPGASQ